MKAHFKGHYKGARVHTYTVSVKHFSLERGTRVLQTHTVMSDSPNEALWFVRSLPEFNSLLVALMEPVTLETNGPKGGRKEQFLGWTSLIGHLMQSRLF